ncbi:hypothetical protein [Salinimicrobium sediminilitoris]|uniref:hypothetical protein n=1 Tax=Salinimicrobium sediminilitoris TaxID=2876715 RepID=UPI001E595399|nr:hypothetical protein [Salinimicrobium sediminilitoris]MCC8361387.1 hypothetical protein [Salinimicrobium sediminilitoris]
MGKKTVAIIGESGEFCPALAMAAVQQDLRLLFISRDETKKSILEKRLGDLDVPAEVEFTTCEKDGCWEADAIAFIQPEEIEPKLLDRIKQVSTQKIVLVIFHPGKLKNKEFCFQDLLPYSRIVELEIKGSDFHIFGRNKEAKEIVQNFFKAAGYHQKE